MNYLVTGAAGFVGGVVAKRLLSQGHSVTTIDNLSTGRIENLPAGINFIKGDDYDRAVLDRIAGVRFDAMIHIAGQSSGEISFEIPEYDLKTNTLSTLLLLKMALSTGCKKFIYTSSMSVYGDAEPELVSEETAPAPKSFYAVGKLASENYMRIFSGYGIQCTALRLFNVFGAGQNMENMKQGMASIYLAQALNTGHIVVKGSGDRFRDFVYVDDVSSAVETVLNRTGNNFEIYNVSNERKIHVEYIIELLEARFKNVTHEYVGGTPGDQHGIYGKSGKIRDLGWKPKISFEEGMERMIQWARKDEKKG